MSSIFRSNLVMEIQGASHSDEMILTVQNFPSGYKINSQYIENKLALRRPSYSFNTPRVEKDEYFFRTGVTNGVTDGNTLTIVVKNNNINSSSYTKGECRANHADYPAFVKYGEDFDYRGGGQFSGRLTTPFVILGAMCLDLLESRKILIGTRILEALGIKDDTKEINSKDIKKLNQDSFPMINESRKEELINKLNEIKDDTVGGKLESTILNLDIGLGEPFFDSLESRISYLLFAIPSVKGVLFGDAETYTNVLGSSVLDKLQIKDNKVNILSNHMGGINGGLTNGNPVVVKTIFKPIASIKKPYNSINILTKENIEITNTGRHDKFILNRACVIVDSFLAIAILDMLEGEK